MVSSTLLVLIFVAATVPMVVSVFAALLPAARARTVDGYFLYERTLDIDSFLKTSVGYSLQAASLFLFFLWGIAYGLYAMFIPVAWGVGYVLMGRMLVKGKLDDFLHFHRSATAETIHGHVWKRLKDPHSATSKFAIWLISAATVVGVGGTLIAEVDYGAKFFVAAAKLTAIPDWGITALIVGFAAFYILWGGYRAVVVTDRVQVPMAYGMFGLFTLGLIFLILPHWFGRALALVLVAAFSGFLWNRLRILPVDDHHNRGVAWLTFLPLAILALVVVVIPGGTPSRTLDIQAILLPSTPDLFGFGFWGLISLALANGVWQFIDISSLQRLQSLKIDVDAKRSVGRGIVATGIEAAGGWFLILITAFALRSLGLSDTSELAGFLGGLPGSWNVLLPMLVFSVAVFVLSTISGLVSAIAFVAYYDFLALLGLHRRKGATSVVDSALSEIDTRRVLFRARVTSLLIVGCIFLGYQLLQLSFEVVYPGVDKISQALYAIYAFQLAILPTVLFVLLNKNLSAGSLLALYP